MTNSAKKWKQETQKQWNKTPCGEVLGDKESLNYFLAVERHRYDEYAPWMRPFFNFSQYTGKRVLEIGYGQGTDLCQFALAGAECFGVDITEQHFNLAKKNLHLRRLKAELYLENANNLHFQDNTFDVVYSFGVLHHTPDTIRCVSEAYRVLKPCGKLIIGLYHRFSVYYWLSVLLVNGLIRGNLKELGYDGLLATIEAGADGINTKPLVKLYSANELRIILGDFNKVSIDVKHLDKAHFPLFGRIIPSFLIPILEQKMGWYVIGEAVK